MRSVCVAAICVSMCAHAAGAHTCASVPSHPRENDKKYAALRMAGDKAFREGKYKRALGEYRESLAYQDEAGAGETFFRLGEVEAMLGNFEKAYSCIIESGPGKIPANRILATAISDTTARDAAQILLDTIQVNTPRYPYATFPEYLALGAIFRRAGLVAQAESADEEGRINREAAQAWDAALLQGGEMNLGAADRAAMEVYHREHRPEAAAILQAQAAEETPFHRRKHSFWYLLVTANL
jgi:tetratricopeptide (TPR) repeat protein